ncbi:MAG: class I SAM-dependent methyltransferase [Arenicellales bacterium]
MGLPDYVSDYGEELTSGILPIVCHLIYEEPGCNVVDLGSASTENCMRFSRNGARVYLDTSGDSLRSRVLRSNELQTSDIDDLLAYCPDAIDVLLFWDILDYLSIESIGRLMSRFGDVMRPGGLLYAMVSQQFRIPSEPALIDVIEADRLRFQFGPLDREGPHYAPKLLEQRMPGFRIEKLYLMQNGVQEHLFLFEGMPGR